MCGIAVLISPRPDPDLGPLADAMLARIRHRGPDAAVVSTFDARGPVPRGSPARVALGHARLRVIDLSDRAAQPMPTPDGARWLVFNGAIYDHDRLRTDLIDRGEAFTSTGDTEVLLRLLARDGPAALPPLDGMFALALLDLAAAPHVLIARDHFGIKPLYHWTDPQGRLALASEIKAFTALPGFAPAVHPERLADFLRRGLTDHATASLFAGVHQLPPASHARIELDRPAVTPLRFPPVPTQPRQCQPAAVLDALRHAVALRLRADVPVGACLSGGLDSSLLVALAAPAAGRMLTTLTARAADPAIDEWPAARATAAMAGARAVAVTPTAADLFARLDALVWTQDEPFASASVFAQHLLFERARAEGLTVMLDGQGADEVFAGYPPFWATALLERAAHPAAALAHIRARAAVHGIPPARQIAEALAALAPASLRRRARRPVNAWIAPALLAAAPDPFDLLTGRARGVRALSLDLLSVGSLPMLLRYEDRNAMAFGIEARLPYLRPALVALGLALHIDDKLDVRTRVPRTKAALRAAAAGLIPEPVRLRTDKLAFTMPDAAWLASPQAMARRAAAADRVAASLTPEGRELVHDGSLRTADASAFVWRVVCLAAWADRFGVNLSA